MTEDDDRLLRYVERFALVLRESGMPPMAARVFAFALADDRERYSATDFATALRASPAAISGAVRYLVHARMLGREREPGTRSDLYTLYDDNLWPRIMLDRMELIVEYEHLMQEGADVVGRDRPGGRRLQESAAFFAFMRAEMPKLMRRWQEQRKHLLDDAPAPDAGAVFAPVAPPRTG